RRLRLWFLRDRFYISRKFSWRPATVTEARLWQARSYCAMDWLFDAEMILVRIKEDELTNKTLRSLYNSTYADFLIRSHRYADALPYLRQAVKLASGAQKTRLTFLTGQIAALAGEKAEAYSAFGKVAGSASSDYRTQFNARIKQSEVFDGSDIEPEVKSLRRMIRYDRNRQYRDQIYYAIANLYLSRGDTTNAIENYRLAAKESTRDGIDKAISQVRLGGLYYDRGQYDEAQPCYAEAVPKLPETYPDYRNLKRRSDILDELSVFSHNVTLQDSLLRLSYLTPEEQLAIIDRIIDELNKKEKEEAEEAAREEFLANQNANGSQLNSSNAPASYTANTSDSWYFYNPSTVSAGKTEFQRRWGSRKLEDDWRRRNKAAFSFDDFNESSDSDDGSDDDTSDTDSSSKDAGEEPVDEEKAKREADPHFPEYYLKSIPTDSTSRALSHDLIREGLFNMGVILKDKMEDYPAAREQFIALNTRYPDNINRLDAYFNMYLMYARENDIAGMERYRNLIISDFPDSKQGIALKDPDYIDNLRKMESEQNILYDRALEAYLDNRNADVHAAYDSVAVRNPMSQLIQRLMFLHAL
ncbi:MAG: tetratricopeptide repeat protein, partial [Muribaculaceae bacterium]|nr:tetratricopeptide repeat protein [Muribaculaceae bacterium]